MINILSIVSFFFVHEFYVSVSYMEYDVERKAIEVQKKIFFDAKKKNSQNFWIEKIFREFCEISDDARPNGRRHQLAHRILL